RPGRAADAAGRAFPAPAGASAFPHPRRRFRDRHHATLRPRRPVSRKRRGLRRKGRTGGGFPARRCKMERGPCLRHGPRQESGQSGMMDRFTYSGSPANIVFGNGERASVGEWIERMGRRHALVLTTPAQADDGTRLADELGDRAAGTFAGAAMHTPVDVTEKALAKVAETGADCVVSLG